MTIDPQLVIGVSTAVLSVVVTLTAVFSSVLQELGKLLISKIRRKAKDFSNGLESLAKFHAVFEQIREKKYVDSVLLFEGKNGGGVPKAGSVFTTRAIFGWATDPDAHPERVYDTQFKIDSHYITLLCEVLERGSVFINYEDLPKGSMLRAFYASEGVKYAQMYFIQLDDPNNSLIYASIASYTQPFDENQTNEIMLLIQRIRSLVA